ncbi:MAG: lysylphosphatidylglycerol synthase transmembrane domain-containing protein [Acidimicrobiales bacterium]
MNVARPDQPEGSEQPGRAAPSLIATADHQRRARRNQHVVVAIGLVGYAIALTVVARRWELPPIGIRAALLLPTALLIELIAKGLFGVQFRDALRRQAHRVTLRAAVLASFVGTAVARLVPAGGALSPSAMAWAVRSEDDHAAGAALRITLTGYGGLLLITGGAIGVALPFGRSPLPEVASLLLAAGLILIGSMALFGSRWLDRFVGVLPPVLRRHFGPTAGGGGMTGYQFVLIMSRIVLEATVLWIVLRAFEINLDPGQAMLTYGTAKVIGGLPATPGGIGLVEGGMIGVLAAIGFGAEAVVAPVLVYQIIDYWIVAVLGLLAAGRISADPASSTRSW